MYVIQIDGAQSFSHMCMYIEFPIQKRNAHALFHVGMVRASWGRFGAIHRSWPSFPALDPQRGHFVLDVHK